MAPSGTLCERLTKSLYLHMSVWWWGEKSCGIHRCHKSGSIWWRAEEKGVEMSERESWWDFVEIFAGSLGCSTPFHLNPQEVLWSRAIFNFWVFGYFHETQGQNVWLGCQRAQNLNQVWGEVGLWVVDGQKQGAGRRHSEALQRDVGKEHNLWFQGAPVFSLSLK